MMRGLWLDKRIGGVPRWYFGDHTHLMRVPDEIRECACFITAEWGSEPFRSTGFFTAVDIEGTDQIDAYLVTARHNIWDPDNGLADAVTVRLNMRDGGSSEIGTVPAEWLHHPSADVVVLPHAVLGRAFQQRVWPARCSATSSFRASRSIGPGDDVYLAGMLRHKQGEKRMLPVVRLGTISALPDEPVGLRWTGDDVVALIEARSLMGFSGSPVFLHLPFWRDPPEGKVLVGAGGTARSGGESYLLGVTHGFYPVSEAERKRDADVHTGISVVVFVDRIMELIDRPDQVRWREEMARKIDESQQPEPARVPDENKPEEFERFEDLTRKLVNTPKKDVDEKRKDES